MLYSPGSGDSEDEAIYIGEGVRQMLVEGSGGPLHAYVNYARGDENPEALYGYEKWRLERLRALKRKFDP
jgi:hypothetical protein